MVRSMFWAGTPRPTDRAPCGSRSMSRTLRPYSTSAAPRLMVDVVLPTPPFWLHIAMTCAGPCSVIGLASGSLPCRALAGSDRRAAAPISGSVSCGRATAELAASARVAMFSDASTTCPIPVVRRVRSAVLPARVIPTVGTAAAIPEEARRRRSVTWRRMPTGALVEPKRLAEPTEEPCGSLSSQGPGMAAGVDLAQSVDGDQRVHLGRRHRRVPEQFLHDADVGAAVEQVRGEGVPQGVRRHLRRQPCALRRRPQDGPRALPGQRPATDVEEQRAAAHPTPTGRPQRRPGADQVVLDRLERVRADGDDALLAALAGQPDGGLPPVEIVDGQPDRLGDARPGAVEQLEQRAVAQS